MGYKEDLKSAVDKATDATLISDNWQYILDVCDKVVEEPEEGSKEVLVLIEKQLSSRDANVQLRTLSLLTSIAENCGSRVRQEIATKHFTNILISKLNDHQIHNEIKIKIVQVITQLSDSFKNDPSLKPIQDANNLVKGNYSNYFPPKKPTKSQFTNRDRAKEEEDLKAAIALSLAEGASGQQQQAQAPGTQAPGTQTQQPAPVQAPQQTPQPSDPRALNFSRVRALYDSFSEDPADLKFRKGDIITVIERVYKDWGKGSLRGNIGLFPFNYVTPLYDPTPEEIAKEAELESSILRQSRNVEKMLTLLTSAKDQQDSIRLTNSEEFRNLYQNIALIKPELATLIDKYRQRKDDLLDLHKKLKDASVIYEDLTDPLKYNKPSQPLYANAQPNSHAAAAAGQPMYAYQQAQMSPQIPQQFAQPRLSQSQHPQQQPQALPQALPQTQQRTSNGTPSRYDFQRGSGSPYQQSPQPHLAQAQAQPQPQAPHNQQPQQYAQPPYPTQYYSSN